MSLLAKLPDPEDYPDFFDACFTYGGDAFAQRFTTVEQVSLDIASPIIRLISGAIDLAMVGLTIYSIVTAFGIEFMPYGLWVSIAATTLIMAFWEYSLGGVTPGKYVLGLKVLTRNLTNITAVYTLARAVVSCGYFLGCAYIVLGGKDVLDVGLSNWLIPWLGGWVVYALTGGTYPHDFLSGTIVIREEGKGILSDL